LAVFLLEAAGPGEAGLERRELKGTTTGLKSTSGRPGQQGEDTKQQVGRSMVDAWVWLATVQLRWMCQTRWHGSMGAFLFIYYLTLPSRACMQLAPPTGYYP